MATFTVHLQEYPYPGARYRLVQLKFNGVGASDVVRLIGDSHGFESEINALKATGINIVDETDIEATLPPMSFMESLILMGSAGG
jgi:hypothetical protein